MAEETNRKIVIASFTTPGGADAALHLLKAAPVSLGNVAIVKRDVNGKVEFTETQDWGIGKSALVGAIAGLLLPGVGTITMAAGGALAAYFIDLGFPDPLLKQMGEGLDQDSSMLVALVDEMGLARASEVIAQAGGTTLGTSHETRRCHGDDEAVAIAGDGSAERRSVTGAPFCVRSPRATQAVMRSCTQPRTLSSDTRTCDSESRSRIVTLWSFADSLSMVTQNGVPTSSWRRYRLPMLPVSS